MRRVGVVGLRAIIYFEVVSTIALLVGVAVANVLQPGAGMHIDPAALNAKAVAGYVTGAKSLHHRRFPHQDDPDQHGRRPRQGRDHAGPDHGGAVRLRALPHGRARRSAWWRCSTISPTPSSASSASSCIWRRSPPLRRWPSPSASSASARFRPRPAHRQRLCHLDPVRPDRLRPHRAAVRSARVEDHPLFQGRAADRLQRDLGRGDDPALDRQAREHGLLARRWSGWCCRPASPSTWTAPRST